MVSGDGTAPGSKAAGCGQHAASRHARTPMDECHSELHSLSLHPCEPPAVRAPSPSLLCCVRAATPALRCKCRTFSHVHADRVEIIANDQGNRTTPSYVGFTDTERLIGDAAKNQVRREEACRSSRQSA
eukprot:1161083-Pelagomonas_calceolata.AAC.3